MQKKQEKSAQGSSVFGCAKWMGHPQDRDEVLEFRKEFTSERAEKAELFLCGLGFFEAYFNGRRVGQEYFKPLFTDYGARDRSRNPAIPAGSRHTVFYYRYDVTPFLCEGTNTLTGLIGNGYYRNTERPEEPFVSYGQKIFLYRLVLYTADGMRELVSGTDTLVRHLPVRSDLYGGDRIDFSAEAETFVPAVCMDAPSGRLQEQREGRGDVPDAVLSPVRTWRRGTALVYDFGYNHSGGLRIRMRGERGRRVKIRFAELLHADGSLNMETGRWEETDRSGKVLRKIDQECEYVLSGGYDEAAPLFSWHCYRYAEIEEAEGLEIAQVCSCFLHTNVEKSGKFFCGERFFEELQKKTRLTVLDNLHAGLLTDCPHREKRQYTGDMQLVAETLLYDLDGQPLLEKFLQDVLSSQAEDGFIPYTAPYLAGGGGYAWSNAVAVLPSVLYRFSGDERYVEQSYGPLVRWIGYCSAHAEGGIVRPSERGWSLGDWLSPEISSFNVPFMNTLCYYRAVRTAEFFAQVLHKKDASFWAARAEEIAAAVNNAFFDRENMRYSRGVQGENVLPLALGIVPHGCEEALRRKVRRIYEENGYHFDTGIVATPAVLDYLTEHGMRDIAYKLMTQTDYPSYAWMLEGETTLPEHWSKRWPDYRINNTEHIVKGGGELSHCHPMFGSVAAWLYKRVAGIDCSEAYKGIIRYAPRFTEYIPHCAAEVKTVFGKASVAWECRNCFCAEITVPAGAEGVFEREGVLVAECGGTRRECLPEKDGFARIRLPAGSWKLRGAEEIKQEEEQKWKSKRNSQRSWC